MIIFCVRFDARIVFGRSLARSGAWSSVQLAAGRWRRDFRTERTWKIKRTHGRQEMFAS